MSSTFSVASPVSDGTRSHAADWVELMAISSGPFPYYSTSLVSALGFDDPKDQDNSDDEDSDYDDDLEILDNVYDELLDRISDEILWRSRVLGGLYPFELNRTATGWSLKLIRVKSSREQTGREVYLACLVISAIRNGLFDEAPAEISKNKRIADVFQAMAYFVSPALLGGGESFWIAFPRPEQDDYGPALERYIEAVGSGALKQDRPPTQKRNKDGGVDVISWRSFDDERSNLLISYGQVASGKRWRDKSVKNKLESHFLRWLSTRPTAHYVPAMYIPHVMHESLRPSKTHEFEVLMRDEAETLEASLGVVVDRIRMTKFAFDARIYPSNGTEQGYRELAKALRWNKEVRTAMLKV